MKSAWAVFFVLLLFGTNAKAWTGPANNKSVSDLEQMSDEALLNEAVGPCVAAAEHGSAAMDYLRTISQVVKKRHNDVAQTPFSEMLVAAAAEDAGQCRKIKKAGLLASEPEKPVEPHKATVAAPDDEDE